MKGKVDRHLEKRKLHFDENRQKHASWFDWAIDLYRQCHRGYYTKVQWSQLGTYATLFFNEGSVIGSENWFLLITQWIYTLKLQGVIDMRKSGKSWRKHCFFLCIRDELWWEVPHQKYLQLYISSHYNEGKTMGAVIKNEHFSGCFIILNKKKKVS